MAAEMIPKQLSMTIQAWAHANWPGSDRLYAAVRPQLPRLFAEGDEQTVSVGLRRASELGWQLSDIASEVNAALLWELPHMAAEEVTQVRQAFSNKEWRQWLSQEAAAALQAREQRLGLAKQQS